MSQDAQTNAAIIGHYSTKTFSFAPVVELNALSLGSDEGWIDAGAGNLWFTYRVHLLRLPLPK